MSQDNLIAQNTFMGGMVQDSLDSLADSKTYRFARNAIHSTRDSKNFGLTNEGSNELAAGVGGVVGALYCEERNWTVLFLKGDQISIFDHATKNIIPVMSAGEFGCSFGFGSCEWIGNGRVEFKSSDPCSELTVYFSAGCEYYKVNIDLMLDSSRKAGLIREIGCETKCGLTDNCEYFKIFKQGCAPKITTKTHDNGGTGGELKAGAYTFIARLVHSDGGDTNWFHFSDVAYVGSEHNIAGEPSSAYIEVCLSCLDCKFSTIELAVVEEIGGIITAKTLNTFNYGNGSMSYRYNGTDGTPIDIKELLIKDTTYLRGKYLQQKDGHMLYYGIMSRKNPNLQPQVNGIETEYVVYEMPYEHVKKYDVKSLMRGETYAFGVVYNYVDGTHSSAFHIPGTPSGGSSGSQVSSVSNNFNEQINDNADLSSGGGFTFSSTTSPQPYESTTEIVSQFKSTGPAFTATYEVEKNTGEQDVMSIYFVGNPTETTSFLQGTSLSVQTGSNTSIFVQGKGGQTINFQPSNIVNQTGDSITLGGVASGSSGGPRSASTLTTLKGFSNTPQGLVPPNNGGGGGSTSGSGETQGSATAELTEDGEIEYSREPADEDSVNNPQNDHFDDVIQTLVDNMDTVAETHQCEELKLLEDSLRASCCWCYGSQTICADEEFTPIYGSTPTSEPCENPQTCCGTGDQCEEGAAYLRCLAEMGDVEQAAASLQDLLNYYNQDDLSPEYNSTVIHEGAKGLQTSIKERIRKKRKKREYSISKTVTYNGQGGVAGGGGSPGGGGDSVQSLVGPTGSTEGDGGTGELSGPMFDCCGLNETEIDIKEVSSGRTEPDPEENILYPCQTDCDGQFIYGGLAGSPVNHHKFPDASEEPHFVSKALGVPYGTYWPDAGEYSDLYIRIMGVRFSNIPIPSADQLPLPLCPNNPYTIVMVKRTDSNKQILIKGLATGTFKIDNNGKTYDQPRYGLNSMESVSYYHDDGDGGRLADIGPGDTHTLYSLDGVAMKPSLAADKVHEELRLGGYGERYGLYAKGKDPDNALHGRRLDALGCRQSVHLHEWEQGSGEHDLDFKTYATGNDAIAPPAGGSVPLMNRSGQPCIWFGSGLEQITDLSFTGDVLSHNVPISEALGHYVSLRRDLADQYGSLENLNYIPLLQGGKNSGSTIEGPVGDIFIGPYSFVKTGFVSDKVGSCDQGDEGKFDIPNQVPDKNEIRCICDGPEDIIHHQNGAWVWTTLPEDGDAADPKNWAGTQTEGSGPFTRTRPYSEAVGQPSQSDMYFPGTTTTHITYIGEFETNPWLREKSKLLHKQWYTDGLDRSQFRFDSGVAIEGDSLGWKDAYLNQFHRELEQASVWQRVVKTLIRTSLNILFPMMGIDNLFDSANGGIDYVGSLVEFPMLAVMWYLMVQVLFRNDTLDKLLGIPICRSDDVGGFKEGYNRGLFFNPGGYNVDYSRQPDIYTYEGMPDPYYTCDCDDCPQGANVKQSGQTSEEIYISDRQIQGSGFDSYTHVRPRSKIHIPASYGKLTNLFVAGGNLFAHTTDAIIPLRRKRAMIASDIGEILLGENGFLLEPEGVITEGITEGYAGLKRHNEHIDSQYGYIFVDAEADIIYRFKGQGQLEPVSEKGMSNFFKEKLNFCNLSQCIDEKITGTSYYSLGVDPRFNRLMVTKSDGDSSFTMSYDLEKGVWISFHDYIPREYIADRRDMYSLTDSGIWRHNVDCNYQTFYGQYYPHVVEFVAIPQDLSPFTWENMIINTEAELCSGCTWVEDIDRTYNKIAYWNSTQGSGTMEVEFVSDNNGSFEDARRLITEVNSLRAHKKRRLWRINEFKDFRMADCRAEPMEVCSKCQPYTDINEGIFDCSVTNTQNFRNKVIADKYTKYRFTYDLDAETKLNTIYVSTYGKKSEI